MTRITYSVVIPVYNGENTIAELAGRLGKLFEVINETCEIIFVDDYSVDKSWSVLEELAAQDRRIKAVKLVRNFGQHNATLCGMAYAKGRYVITIDDDLQHVPEDIPKLIAGMKKNQAQVVIAKLTGKKHQWYRQKASDLIRWLSEITINKPKGIYLSSFRLMERQVVDRVLSLNPVVLYLPALIFYFSPKVANVEIEHRERQSGSSNYSIPKMFKLAIRLLVCNAFLIPHRRNIKPVYVVEKVISRQPCS